MQKIEQISKKLPFCLTHETEFSLKKICQMHSQKEIKIIYVQKGSLTLFANYKTHSITQGDLVFLNSFVPYAFLDASEDADILSLTFLPELIFSYGANKTSDRDWMILSVIKRKAFHIFPCAKDKELRAFFRDAHALFGAKTYGYEYLMHAKILFLYLYLLKKWNLPELPHHSLSGKSMETVRNVLEYIEMNFSTVTATELAEHFVYHRYTFSRNFKLLTGFSVSKYIEHTKIEHAKFLLATTDQSVTDIAFSVGYEDSSYFAKCFLEAERISPTKFRALYIQNEKGETQ